MKIVFALFVMLSLCGSYANASPLTFLDRVHVMFGMKYPIDRPSMIEGDDQCAIRLHAMDPLGYARLVDLSLVNERTGKAYRFHGHMSDLTDAVANDTEAFATSTVHWDEDGAESVEKISITNLPDVGIQGSTLTVTDSDGSYSCSFH